MPNASELRDAHKLKSLPKGGGRVGRVFDQLAQIASLESRGVETGTVKLNGRRLTSWKLLLLQANVFERAFGAHKG